MRDMRSPQIKLRTANANRNLLRMHLEIQLLWESLLYYEEQMQRQYDYVLFFRDDAQWMDDFNLNRLLSLGGAD